MITMIRFVTSTSEAKHFKESELNSMTSNVCARFIVIVKWYFCELSNLSLYLLSIRHLYSVLPMLQVHCCSNAICRCTKCPTSKINSVSLPKDDKRNHYLLWRHYFRLPMLLTLMSKEQYFYQTIDNRRMWCSRCWWPAVVRRWMLSSPLCLWENVTLFGCSVLRFHVVLML